MSDVLNRQIAALQFELARHEKLDHLSDAESLRQALVTLEWMARHEGIIKSAVRLANDELRPLTNLPIDYPAVTLSKVQP